MPKAVVESTLTVTSSAHNIKRFREAMASPEILIALQDLNGDAREVAELIGGTTWDDAVNEAIIGGE